MQLPLALPKGFRSYVSDRDVERCNKLLTYHAPDARVYSVSKIPLRLEWGPEGGGHDNKSKIIFTNGGPLTVLILGEVLAFFRDATWKNRVIVKLAPLSGLDGERLDAIMVDFATSSKGEYDICAVRNRN